MKWYEIVVGALIIVVSIVTTAVVLFQQGHRAGINGAISGGADTFLSKSKARSDSEKLRRVTKYVAIVFMLLVVAATVISRLK